MRDGGEESCRLIVIEAETMSLVGQDTWVSGVGGCRLLALSLVRL